MLIEEIFETIKNDYEQYGDVLQMEYLDDWQGDTRFIFKVEGDKLLVYIRDDMEELEIMFTIDIEFILKSTINECIKKFNECYYYAPNVYEE